jgi:hypothetical protein
MGKASRDKGARAEREAVRILQDAGLASERVPLSGSAGGRYCGDVSVPVLGIDRVLEVKCRASGWKQAYAFLGANYGLVIRADREEPLMVMRLKDFAKLAIEADIAWLENLPIDHPRAASNKLREESPEEA